MARNIDLFNVTEFSRFRDSRLADLRSEISNRQDQAFLDEDVDALANELAEKYRLTPLQIRFDDTEVTSREEMIPADKHPRIAFDRPSMRGRSFPRQVIRYFIPFDGDENLLDLEPNPRVLWTERVTINSGNIEFDVIDFYQDAAKLKAAYNRVAGPMRQQLEHVNNNVEEFNRNLYDQATTLIQAQQENIGRRQSVVTDLGFKVRQPESKNSDPQQLPRVTSAQTTKEDQFEWDVFICHASEDKADFVGPLAERLAEVGLKVWYDESSMTVGDSLRRSIDAGLVKAKFGVVILSNNFFDKEWPQRELDGLTLRERDGRKVILPVWLGVDIDDVAAHSPTLADRVAARSEDGLEKVTVDLLRAIQA